MLINNKQPEKDPNLLEKLRHIITKLIQKRVPRFEDVEDLTQEVFYRGFKTLSQDSETRSIQTDRELEKYFTTIAMNEVRRFYKNKKITLIDLPEDEWLKIPAENLSAETGIIILDILGNLPVKQRLIYFLQTELVLKTFISIFSVKLVADTLETSEKTIEKLADGVPMKDEQLKLVVEMFMTKELKSTVRDERWKGKNFLKKVFNR